MFANCVHAIVKGVNIFATEVRIRTDYNYQLAMATSLQRFLCVATVLSWMSDLSGKS